MEWSISWYFVIFSYVEKGGYDWMIDATESRSLPKG